MYLSVRKSRILRNLSEAALCNFIIALSESYVLLTWIAVLVIFIARQFITQKAEENFISRFRSVK